MVVNGEGIHMPGRFIGMLKSADGQFEFMLAANTQEPRGVPLKSRF
jgi:glycine cleavage system pyridoxal-binding protein P